MVSSTTDSWIIRGTEARAGSQRLWVERIRRIDRQNSRREQLRAQLRRGERRKTHFVDCDATSHSDAASSARRRSSPSDERVRLPYGCDRFDRNLTAANN